MIVGGAQENTLLSVRGLQARGHDVTLATGPTEGPEGRLLEHMAPGGAASRTVAVPHLCRELNPWADWRAYRELRRLFRGPAFDVVHTHSSKAGVLGRIAARRAGVPLVVHTVHGQPFHPYERRWRNGVYIQSERWAARYCDHIFAVCQAMIDQCVAARVAPAGKYSVVYSGMELAAFTAARDPALRQRLGIPESAPVIGKIARLFHLKGHEFLLRAVGPVVQEFPEVRFLLVGDGILRGALEEQVRAAGMARNFVFTGLVPPATIPQYVAQMDVLVHLSLREGLPRTVVQALAAGVPAVGFALDGTPEVILDGETGLLCPAPDADAVTAALLRLLRDPALRARLGGQGRRLVQERFSVERMVTALEAAYLSGLKR